MTIFIRLLKIMKTIGFIVVLFFISYLMTSVAYYSRNHSEDRAYSIELIDDKNIKVIEQKGNEYIDKYNKEIHLNVVDKEIMINTQKNTIFILKK